MEAAWWVVLEDPEEGLELGKAGCEGGGFAEANLLADEGVEAVVELDDDIFIDGVEDVNGAGNEVDDADEGEVSDVWVVWRF